MVYFTAFLISLFITITLIPVFRTMAVKLQALDIPNERKVHSAPIPKSGGIAMALGFFVPVVMWVHGDAYVRALLIGTGIIVIFGLLDDFKNLGYRTKFCGQFLAALIVILYGRLEITSMGMLLPDGLILPHWIAVPLTLVVIVGVTNAINLADGLDGLAGGLTILIFICLAYLAYRSGNAPIVIMSVAVVGAIFGFLRFNTYPANIFMGDTGSQFLGFLAITLSLKLTQGHTPLSPFVPLLLLGFPILDTLAVMTERISRGKSPFMADKNHFHHKLMRRGFRHAESVFIMYIFHAVLVTSAFVFRYYSDWFLIVFYLLFSGMVLTGFTITERNGWQYKRYDVVDTLISSKLAILKEKNILIKTAYGAVRVGLPALFIFACMLPQTYPSYFSLMTACCFAVLVIVRNLKKEWLGFVLRCGLYLSIPFVVYLGEVDISPRVPSELYDFYNLSFGIIVIFVILTLKYTRRQKGFKTTPMDFLIIFIALVVPQLPDPQIQSYSLGLLAAKIIVLFFSYEVFIGEQRGEFDGIFLSTLAAFGVVLLKGLIQF